MKKLVVLVLCAIACKNNKETPVQTLGETEALVEKVIDSVVAEPPEVQLKSFEGLADTTFVRLADFSSDFVYDMRYATENNFLKAKVYDCAECYTRVKTAKAIIKANQDFMKQGVKIKFFDCYRPNSVQYKMWKIVPNPQYVADPVKGSIHNKGGAVDITLVDMDGKELDMGTDFDFFGKRAYHDNTELPQHILDNRKLLKETMEAHGFWSIRTEWWHYNLSAGSNDKVANFKWKCDKS
ncbi:M15 family metallopeptidase [Flagellimonas myxillae]|uniref:M15 family metallopeptidase n=1 Tax=Flagellimonas myxillae TaxID=2942214 RepID=UPI00201E9D3D|nr:M15 family metallopeptidase [Muricauda myxillae]MCL6266276.1 M15 family metallopeptidase [Muricauda myxillae]